MQNPLSSLPSNTRLRRVTSFACRRRRLTETQQALWDRLWPQYGLSSVEGETLDPAALFESPREIILEIGFGDGRSLLKMAKENPTQGYIGIEVYRLGVSRLLAGIDEANLQNIRIFLQDAVLVLKNSIPASSLFAINIFFPDPWPKSRHHKRRLLQPDFVELLADKLKPRGILHLATDWQDYAQHMMSVISNNPKFRNQAGIRQFSPRPDGRALTKYEQRGRKLRHSTWDLLFERL